MKKIFVVCLVFWGFAATISEAKPWGALSDEQHVALAPLSQEWDRLPETEQDYLLNTAKGYARLGDGEKKRFHAGLPSWSKLTHEQRQAAREKYKAFQKVPAEQQEEVRKRSK